MKTDTRLLAISVHNQTEAEETLYITHQLIEIFLHNPDLDALKLAFPRAESTPFLAYMKGKFLKKSGAHKHFWTSDATDGGMNISGNKVPAGLPQYYYAVPMEDGH